MSKIAISGASTGSATFTIESPATSTNRTLTLPDNTGTILTSATAASSIPGTISQADQWRLTTTLTGYNGILTSNLERNDTNFALIGSGMTQSSGVFSFPTTGIYTVDFVMLGEPFSDGYAGLYAESTTDNGSNWEKRASASISGRDAAGEISSAPSGFIFNVTDVATCKVRFATESFAASSTLSGNTSINTTFFTFIRLGSA